MSAHYLVAMLSAVNGIVIGHSIPFDIKFFSLIRVAGRATGLEQAFNNTAEGNAHFPSGAPPNALAWPA